jgi:hypothetical protein
MIVANVIWAANWPYWYDWFPLSAFIGFVAEFATFHFYQRRCHSWSRSFVLVALANLVSFLVGLIGLGIITAALPDRAFLVPQPLGYPPWQHYYLIPLQFLAAYFLSVAIEFFIYRGMSHHHAVHRLAAGTFMSNLASYAVIFVGYTLLWAPRFRSPDEWFISLFN